MHSTTFHPTLIGTGKIFPPAIESMDWIGYHGTSGYYSADIERDGFLLTKPLPVDDLKRLVNIAVQHGEDASDVQGFIELRSMSFTPTSELAIFYVRPESFGGQGLLLATRLIDALFQKHAAKLATDDTAHLTTMRDRIALIRAERPVIYAVNFAGLKRISFDKLTLSIHVFEPIPASALVAKIVIDHPVDYASIDVRRHNDALRTIFRSPGYHYIKQLAS